MKELASKYKNKSLLFIGPGKSSNDIEKSRLIHEIDHVASLNDTCFFAPSDLYFVGEKFIFDYVENVFIIKMISSFPDLQVTTVKVASTFTILKSSFTMVFFVLLIVGVAVWFKQKSSEFRK